MFTFFLRTVATLFITLSVFSAYAQTKVVVIPMGGDDISQCTAISRCEAGKITFSCPSGDQQISCPIPIIPKRVFLTSSRHTGALGGLEGGDAICQGLADDSGLNGEFKAWLSDSVDSPSTRFTQSNTPYVRVDGALIANDYADLTDGTIVNPICVFENGDASSFCGGGFSSTWTSTLSNGQPTEEASRFCSGWTVSVTGRGNTGLTNQIDRDWSERDSGGDPFSLRCDDELFLYCFEQ